MLPSEPLSSCFCLLRPVITGKVSHLAARRSSVIQLPFGIIPFTDAALLSLHSELCFLIEPSPASRPASATPRSETNTALQPTSRMDLPLPLSSSTPESSIGARRYRESTLDPHPSCADT
jgi:hypothetical protein